MLWGGGDGRRAQRRARGAAPRAGRRPRGWITPDGHARATRCWRRPRRRGSRGCAGRRSSRQRRGRSPPSPRGSSPPGAGWCARRVPRPARWRRMPPCLSPCRVHCRCLAPLASQLRPCPALPPAVSTREERSCVRAEAQHARSSRAQWRRIDANPGMRAAWRARDATLAAQRHARATFTETVQNKARPTRAPAWIVRQPLSGRSMTVGFEAEPEALHSPRLFVERKFNERKLNLRSKARPAADRSSSTPRGRCARASRTRSACGARLPSERGSARRSTTRPRRSTAPPAPSSSCRRA